MQQKAGTVHNGLKENMGVGESEKKRDARARRKEMSHTDAKYFTATH